MLSAAQQERRPVSNWALCVALKECERLRALEEPDNELEEMPSSPRKTATVTHVSPQTVTEPKVVPPSSLLLKIAAAKAKMASEQTDTEE